MIRWTAALVLVSLGNVVIQAGWGSYKEGKTASLCVAWVIALTLDIIALALVAS